MSGDKYIIRDQNAMHFLTFTVIDWVDVFSRKEYKLELVESMNYCVREKGLSIYGWVIMSNHMHVIWQAKEGYSLSAIIRDYKKFTAKRITKYKFWQDSNHAIELHALDTKMKEQKLDYIHNNPVKAMLVHNPEDYVFSSAIDYIDGSGLVVITKMH